MSTALIAIRFSSPGVQTIHYFKTKQKNCDSMSSFQRQHQKLRRKPTTAENWLLRAHACACVELLPQEPWGSDCSAALTPATVWSPAFPHRRQRAVLSPYAVEKQLAPLSCSEWCLCRSAAVYGIMSSNPASFHPIQSYLM